MRRAKKSSGASLDSLLDTMTNVVGILVIMLTVTQLGVGEAVKRISTTDSVKPEVLERAKLKLAEIQAIRDELIRRLKALVYDETEDLEKELARLRREIADLETDLAGLGETHQIRDKSVQEELRRRSEEVKKLIEEHKEEEKKLLAKINTNEKELATMRAQLADTPEVGPPPAKIVNLPNPRKAPEGAKPLTFLCRDGRVVFADLDAYQDDSLKFATYLVGRKKLYGGPEKGVDGQRLTEEFNSAKRASDDRQFDLQLMVRGRVPKLVLKRRDDTGETPDQFDRTTSRLQRKIRSTDPKRYYLQFLVWPDSFEAYLAARRVATERGLLAGWVGMTSTGEYNVNLAGEIRCGPPPPKPPPRKPGDPVPPKPPPRPVPTDIVD